MATLIETGLLNNFAPVFTFLLVYILAYAVLVKSKLIENQGINAIVAFLLAGMTLFFKPAVVMIDLMAPWFVVLLMVGFFILLILMIFGLSSKEAATLFKNPGVYWTIIILGIIIFLFALGEASQVANEESEDSNYQSHFKNIAFSPQVLGTLFVLVIAGCAMLLIK